MKLATVVTAMTLAYWGLLFTLTHIPATQIPELGASDKLLHFVAYFVLAVGVGAHLLVTKRWNRFTLSIAMLVLMVFAGFDELTQLLVGRTAEWKDWGADLIGIIAGTISFAVLINLLQRQKTIQALLEPETLTSFTGDPNQDITNE